ncbi:MAG: hypothetical protein H6671_06860 [Anaerolineaceae bacterium]|nr:hypothetical protein [Anaerolineaceae bacterium]
MRKLTLLLLIGILLMPLVITAQDASDDNACFEGGSMWRENGDGCPTEWHWIVGWYLANWENNGGWSNPDNFFPDWADPQSVLPPLPEFPKVVYSGGGVSYPSGGCMAFPTGHVPNGYVDFSGSYFLDNDQTYYDDAACTHDSGWLKGQLIVYAPAGYDAPTLCRLAFPDRTGAVLHNDDIYTCVP